MPDSGLQDEGTLQISSIKKPDRQNKQPRFYLPQLDALRFFAFFAVFLLHALPAIVVENHPRQWQPLALVGGAIERSGENGVQLFFLLSAYLITELLTKEKRETGDIHLKMFYIRRILRIWPLYYFVVLIGLLIQPLNPNFHLTRSTVLTFLFFVSNWHVMFHGFLWSPIYPLWTVSTEEQFYLLWPFAMRIFSRRTLLLLCGFVILVLPLISYNGRSYLWRTGRTESIVILLFFPLGGFLSMALKKHSSPLPSWQALGIFLLGMACWLVGGICARQAGTLTAPSPCDALVGRSIVCVGTVLIFLGFLRCNPLIMPKWMVYLGKISYGLYVYHVLVHDGMIAVANKVGLGLRTGPNHSIANLLISCGIVLPVTLLGTVLVASLSYRYLEKPFLLIKDRFALIHSRAV
jgi:peptidoglycan/LPS O-acetylase OafA/YrhL